MHDSLNMHVACKRFSGKRHTWISAYNFHHEYVNFMHELACSMHDTGTVYAQIEAFPE